MADFHEKENSMDDKARYFVKTEDIEHVHELSEKKNSLYENSEFRETEKRIVRKFDFLIIPCLFIVFLFSNLDKSNIGNSETGGMGKDLNLKDNEYGNAVSLLYVTYVVFETPVALSIKYLGPKYLLSVTYLLFGICCLCTSFAVDYHSLLACRMLVGLFESSTIPSIDVILSMLYTRGEMAKRCSVVYSAAAISGAFGGLLAFGLLHMDGVANWQGWRWLFAVEGGLSILGFPVLIILLPHDPRNAWWLSEKEKAILSVRLEKYDDFHQDEKFSFKEVGRAFRDLNFYLFCSYQICADVTMFGISTFLPSIIKGMGFTSYSTQLMTIPIYFVSYLSFALVGYLSDRFGIRGIFLIACLSSEVIGYSILVSVDTLGVRYYGCIMIAFGLYVGSGLSLMWLNNNVAGHYKRATASGMATTIGNIGGVIVGQIYTSDTAPRYFKGLKITLGLTCGGILFSSLILANFYRKNKMHEKILEQLEDDGLMTSNDLEIVNDDSPAFKFLL